MILKPFGLIRLVVAAVVLLGVSSLPASANCKVIVKNCVDREEGFVTVEVFDGDDSVRLIPASRAEDMAWGQSESMFCYHRTCDVHVHLAHRPGTLTKLRLTHNDQCDNLTFRRVSTNPNRYSLDVGTPPCLAE